MQLGCESDARCAAAFAPVDPVVWQHRSDTVEDDGTVHLRPVRALTRDTLATYKQLNSMFVFKPKYVPPKRVLTNPAVPRHNEGADNENYDLILHVGDVLGSETAGDQREYCWRHGTRYTVVEMLGQGTFGQVVKCRDEVTDKLVAIKVLKNKPAYFKQGLLEIGILTVMNTNADPTGEQHTLRFFDHFLYRNHLCLVNELLSMNLYELIKQNNFHGVSAALIRTFIRQVLMALDAMERAGIIHCDMKPENILLQKLQGFDVTLIDFGSACFETNTMYSYIQSRHYRSPEVLLGNFYSCAIDMWSLGCIAAELFLGIPIFPGANEYNQLFKIIELLGMPPAEMIRNGSRSYKFFKQASPSGAVDSGDAKDSPVEYRLKTMAEYERDAGTSIERDKRYYSYRTLTELVMKHPMRTGMDPCSAGPAWQEGQVRRSFLHFLNGCLQIDPRKRWTPAQALAHPFLNDGILCDGWVPPAPRRPPGPIRALTQADLASSLTCGGSASGTAQSDTNTFYSRFVAAMKRHEIIDVVNESVLYRLATPLHPEPLERLPPPHVITRGNRSRSMSDARLQAQMMAMALNSPGMRAAPPRISLTRQPQQQGPATVSGSCLSPAYGPGAPHAAAVMLHSPPMPVNGGGLRTVGNGPCVPGSGHSRKSSGVCCPSLTSQERHVSSSASSVSSAAVGARVLQGGALGGRRLSVGEKKKTSRKVKRGTSCVQNDKHGPTTTAASMQVLEDTLMLGSPQSSSVCASQMPPSFDLDASASASSSSCGLSSGGSSSIESSPLQQRLPQQRVVTSSRSGVIHNGSSVVSSQQPVGDSAASWNGPALGQSYYSQWRMAPNSAASSLLTPSGFSSAGGGPISPTGGDLASIVGSIPIPSGNSDTLPISLGASSSTNYVERAMNQRRGASMKQHP